MNLLTYLMHLASSGAVAYYTASQIRDSKTRPIVLKGLHLSEAGSVGFLSALSERAASEGDTWLAEKLEKHALDETKHSQIFAHALKQIDKNLIDSETKTASKSQSKQGRSPLFAAYYEGYSKEQLSPAMITWDVFMASTYIMELDAGKDYMRMANVLPDDERYNRNLKLGMLSIAKDETGHAAYLYEAMMRRMPAKQVENLVDEWRTRKVQAIFKVIDYVLQDTDKIEAA
ncbi:ferritin-like domain-containing protein [Nostoc sp. UHCC 0252]|uniref:ferritin-like domain-containing protein n=1 Tax=Nostoc sp. UHCC 0252 TaxID=3110241 RepID=UPI002B1F76EC|nr:ferritin-like domain-containing protein [Nostoc sp. UHCC 0252]MEA5605812.1 ferritin-like domain-containing protein [Nostoc sp. UHCC 0252]